jgi:uncharacterized protein (DUF697 family)
MTKEEKKKCGAIIHTASVAAGTVGAYPIPGSDIFVIAAIQGAMIISLGAALNVSVTKTAAKEMVKTFMISQIGKNLAGCFVKLVPVVGSAVNAIIAASLTEALGWDSVIDFDERRPKNTAHT